MMKKFILLLFVLCGFAILQGCSTDVNEDMQTLKSKNELMSILKQYNDSGFLRFGFSKDTALEENAADDAPPSSDSGERDYSKTNTQVEGIDEADIVKTDGDYIYLVRQNKIIIADAYPVDEMEVIHTLDFTEDNFYPNYLYVEGDYMVVLGYEYNYDNENKHYEPYVDYYYGYHRENVKALVYDKNDFTTTVNEIGIEGYLVTSRMIGDELLLITNKYINYYAMKNSEENNEEYEIRPSYTVNDDEYMIDYDEIHYKEGTSPDGFVSLMKFDISNNRNEVDVYTYMGSASNVYVSYDNVYIAQYMYHINNFFERITGDATEQREATLVTKIDYSDEIHSIETVEVPGRVNNQFSMDEYKGNFRIATTKGNTWDSTSSSNLYIYDENMDFLGKLDEDLAKGERIQSVRFVGDRAYIVTFRTIDPFFVIDTSDPENPVNLGELKLPGFSTYMHPYDENHVIGFGFETEEGVIDGREFARIVGLKLTLFDVTDPENPVDKFSNVIPYHSYSEATYNHKALLFSKEKGIIGFPLTVTSREPVTITEGNKTYTTYRYLYKQVYQVVGIDINSGFEFKDEITHFDQGKEEYYTYGYQVLRGLYIENNLYTVSYAKIQVHDLQDFTKVKELDLDFNEEPYYYID